MVYDEIFTESSVFENEYLVLDVGIRRRRRW